jgi:isoleucyl-tRNA synthetase
VLSHGFFLDETGRKMSKSLGNIVDPQEVVARFGADILRLWVSYVDFKADMPISEDLFTQVTDAYRRIRNTVRFLLGNLYDFDPATDAVPRERMLEPDRWAMHQLQRLVGRVTEAHESFEFHRVYHALNNFCAVDLSAFYLDMLKDRLYTSAAGGMARRSAQTALYHLVRAMAQLLVPVLTHTAEEIWQHLPGEKEESVQLSDWPLPELAWTDEALEAKWDRLLVVRGEVAKAMEIARNRKVVSQPLAAQVTIWATGADRALLEEVGGELASVLIVSQARLAAPEELQPEGAFTSEEVGGLAVYVQPAAGVKCERCWLYSPTVGEDAEYQSLCARCAATLKGEAS